MNLSALFAATPSLGAAAGADPAAAAEQGGDAAALAAVFRSLVESFAGDATLAPAGERSVSATPAVTRFEQDMTDLDAAGATSDQADREAELLAAVPVASDPQLHPNIHPAVRVAPNGPPEGSREASADSRPDGAFPSVAQSVPTPARSRITPLEGEAVPEDANSPSSAAARITSPVSTSHPPSATTSKRTDMLAEKPADTPPASREKVPVPSMDTFIATAKPPATIASEDAPADPAAHVADARVTLERRDMGPTRESANAGLRSAVPTPFVAERATAAVGQRHGNAFDRSPRDGSPGRSAEALTAHVAALFSAAVADQTSTPSSSVLPATTAGPVLHQAATVPVTAAALSTIPAAHSALPESSAVQIVQSIRLHAVQGGGDARIRLEPGQFGEVTIAVRVRNGEVTASVRAESPVVREWLQSNQAVLREGLADQNLVLSKLDITEPHTESRDSSAPRDGGARDGQQERQASRRRNARAHQTFSESFEDVA